MGTLIQQDDFGTRNNCGIDSFSVPKPKTNILLSDPVCLKKASSGHRQLPAPIAVHANYESDTELECRICRDSADDNEPLIHPCECRGSLGLIHTSCLQKWLQLRPGVDMASMEAGDALHNMGTADGLSCEVCHERYRVIFRRELRCNAGLSCSSNSWKIYMEAFFVCSSIPMLLLEAFWIDDSDPMQLPTRLLLGLLNFMVFLLFPLTMIRLYQRWAFENSTLILLPLPASQAGATGDDSCANRTPGSGVDEAVCYDRNGSRRRSNKEVAVWGFTMVSILAALVSFWVFMEQPASNGALLIIVSSGVGGSLFSMVTLKFSERLFDPESR